MLVNMPRAYEVMDKHGLDGLVAADPINIYYLTDFSSPLQKMGIAFTSFAVLPRKENDPAVLVVSATSLNHLERSPSWVPNLCVFNFPINLLSGNQGEETPDPATLEAFPQAMPWPHRDSSLFDRRDIRLTELYRDAEQDLRATASLALKKAITDAGLSKGNLGFDDPRILKWQRELGLDSLMGIDAYNVFREIRMVKSEAEIELIRHAGQKNEQAMNAVIDAIAPGVPITEIERVHKMKWAELDGQANFLVVSIRGLSSGDIAANELIKLDGTGFYRNYIGDIGRTVVCGEPTQEMRDKNKAVMKGLDLAYQLIRPGGQRARGLTKSDQSHSRRGFPRIYGCLAPFRRSFAHGSSLAGGHGPAFDARRIPISRKYGVHPGHAPS